MEWVTALQGQVVGLDTTPLIYFIEENPTYLETIRPFFVAMDRSGRTCAWPPRPPPVPPVVSAWSRSLRSYAK